MYSESEQHVLCRMVTMKTAPGLAHYSTISAQSPCLQQQLQSIGYPCTPCNEIIVFCTPVYRLSLHTINEIIVSLTTVYRLSLHLI